MVNLPNRIIAPKMKPDFVRCEEVARRKLTTLLHQMYVVLQQFFDSFGG